MNRQRKTRNEWMEKLKMPIAIQGRLDKFQDRGFIITYNPKRDGNCQFSAVFYLLNRIGIHTSPMTLQQNIVEYLRCTIQQTMLGNLSSYLYARLGKSTSVKCSKIELMEPRLRYRQILIYTLFRIARYQRLSNHTLIAVIMCKVTHEFFYAIVLRVKVNIT